MNNHYKVQHDPRLKKLREMKARQAELELEALNERASEQVDIAIKAMREHKLSLGSDELDQTSIIDFEDERKPAKKRSALVKLLHRAVAPKKVDHGVSPERDPFEMNLDEINLEESDEESNPENNLRIKGFSPTLGRYFSKRGGRTKSAPASDPEVNIDDDSFVDDRSTVLSHDRTPKKKKISSVTLAESLREKAKTWHRSGAATLKKSLKLFKFKTPSLKKHLSWRSLQSDKDEPEDDENSPEREQEQVVHQHQREILLALINEEDEDDPDKPRDWHENYLKDFPSGRISEISKKTRTLPKKRSSDVLLPVIQPMTKKDHDRLQSMVSL